MTLCPMNTPFRRHLIIDGRNIHTDRLPRGPVDLFCRSSTIGANILGELGVAGLRG